jgi:membrane fusion protein (multidrug efflux system)
MTDSTPENAPSKNGQLRRKFFYWFSASLLTITLLIVVYYLIWGQFSEWTDDAYVSGNQVILTPQVSGIITKITADDTDFVEEGRILIQLDTTDAVIRLEKCKDELAQTVRSIVQKFELVKELSAEREARRAELLRAEQDFKHREKLIDAGGVSLEDLEHAIANLSVAMANLALTEHKLRAAYAEVEGTTVENHPIVNASKDNLRAAWVALERCKIAAPVTGLIAQRRAQVGTWVNPNDPLLAIVPLDQMWVNANYKEVQLKNIRIGQPAKLVSDTYGGSVTYEGTVLGVAGGTGAVFSILPPQNATGNWIKIVQRVPVRISLNPKQLKEFPLRLGLSMEVSTDTHNREGSYVPLIKPEKPIYETDIFELQEIGAEGLIQEILQTNMILGADVGTGDETS